MIAPPEHPRSTREKLSSRKPAISFQASVILRLVARLENMIKAIQSLVPSIKVQELEHMIKAIKVLTL